MKKEKSMFTILGVLLLSLAFVSSASASPPHHEGDGGGGSKPKPPTSCVVAPCPLP